MDKKLQKMQCICMRFDFKDYAAHGVYVAGVLDFMWPLLCGFAVQFGTQAA